APVQHPRGEHGRVPPYRPRTGWGPDRPAGDGRDEPRHCSVLALLVGQVGQPGGEHARTVEEESGRGREDLDVPGPPQTLVTLRAVGRQVEEVAACAPHDVLVQTVEQGIGALEP